MKSEKPQESIGMVHNDLAAEAGKNRKQSWKYLAGAIAAILVLAISLHLLFGNSYQTPPDSTLAAAPTPHEDAVTMTPISLNDLGLANLVAAPTLPITVQFFPFSDENKKAAKNYSIWKNFQEEWDALYALDKDSVESLYDFFYESTVECLSGTGNQLYSPMSTYMALAMLAECSAGSTQKEILKLLGADSIAMLHQQVQNIWIAYYHFDGQTTCIFANSVWLDSAFPYKEDPVRALQDFHYSSVFSGDLGTPVLDSQLQSWINAMTGNKLKEQVGSIQLDPAAVLALVSTVNFEAEWASNADKFKREFTREGIFHSSSGDITVDYMQKTTPGPEAYYWGEGYTATCQHLTGDFNMWLILPDEGLSTQDVLQNADWFKMMWDPESWKNQEQAELLYLKLPKFDISCQLNLRNHLSNLGVKQIFDFRSANFSPLNDSNIQIAVDKINHAVRVSVDEEGVSAASYTMVELLGGGNPEITEMKFERPFLFVITTREGLPIYVGIVEEP